MFASNILLNNILYNYVKNYILTKYVRLGLKNKVSITRAKVTT